MNKYLIIDGQLHATGVRNKVDGGYISLAKLGISESLTKRINEWLESYELEHYNGYEDTCKVRKLDDEGMAITKAIIVELPESKVEYFSAANLTVHLIE